MSDIEKKWYLHPLLSDAHTNTIIAQRIIGTENPEEASLIRCADGERRPLWYCPKGLKQVRWAISNIDELNLKFEVYLALGKAEPGLWILWKASVEKKRQDGLHRRQLSYWR